MVLALGGISQSQGQTVSHDEPIALTLQDPNWRPHGAPTYTNEVRISVKLYNTPDETKRGYVIFELIDVTSWPGYAMNKGTQSDADLQWANQLPPENNNRVRFPGAGQTAKWWIKTEGDMKAPSTFRVYLWCFDDGAYGRLKATYYYGGRKRGQAIIKIPRDDNHNRIADSWERQHNMYQSDETPALAWAESDLEEGPTGNTNNGDGFSVFEEYRGWRLAFTHVEGNPAKKDLFIYSKCPEGIGYAINLPDIFECHRISINDIGGAREMGINQAGIPGARPTSQKAVRVLQDFRTPDQVLSAYGQYIYGAAQAVAPYSSPNVPYRMYQAFICYNVIRFFTLPNRGNSLYNIVDPEDEDTIKKVIAHEIGHHINLRDRLLDENGDGQRDYPIGTGVMFQEYDIDILDIGSTYPASYHAAEYRLR